MRVPASFLTGRDLSQVQQLAEKINDAGGQAEAAAVDAPDEHAACHSDATAAGAGSETPSPEQPSGREEHAVGGYDLGQLDLARNPPDNGVSGLGQGVDDIGCVDVERHGEFLAPGRCGRLQRAEEGEIVTGRPGRARDPQANAMSSH